MPFAIWCTTCPKETIIGQGVRFNAEKKKVGNYYSTPIYSFRMKHTACGGWIEIRTDPKNTAYVVTDGAKKRDTGEDKILEGDLQLKTEEEKDKLRNDAFAALEVTIDDRRQASVDKSRINELIEATGKDWDDPYKANQKLRKGFRAGRKQREKDHTATEALKDRMSLGIELLAETEEDRMRAGFVDFGEHESASQEQVVRAIQARELFPSSISPSDRKSSKHGTPKLKAELASEQSKARLKRELGQNTKAVLDPFLSSTKSTSTKPLGLKRKRETQGAGNPTEDSEDVASNVQPTSSLVHYDDSD